MLCAVASIGAGFVAEDIYFGGKLRHLLRLVKLEPFVALGGFVV